MYERSISICGGITNAYQKSGKLSKELEELGYFNKDFQRMLKKGLQALLSLRNVYQRRTFEEKRKIIGMLYPEKIVFKYNAVRTTRVNEIAMLISLIDKD